MAIGNLAPESKPAPESRNEMTPELQGDSEEMVHTDKVTLTLPEVDIYASPDLWAVLDEGCNSTVHGSEWASNAIPKLETLGYRTIFTEGLQKSFKGLVGGAASLGTRTLPFSIMGSEGEAINGIMDSHEIEGSAPLLLSQLAQISLGAIKDTRKGLLWMHKPSRPDDPIQIPLYRTKGAGLLCINLSAGLARARINLPKAVTDFCLQGDDSTSEDSSMCLSNKATHSKAHSSSSEERNIKRAKLEPAGDPKLAMVGESSAATPSTMIPKVPPVIPAAKHPAPPKVKAEAVQQDRLRVLITTRGYNYAPILNRFKRDRDWHDVTLKTAAVELLESPNVDVPLLE